jgi:hypothetical protein
VIFVPSSETSTDYVEGFVSAEIRLVVQLVIGAIFLLSGASKLRSPLRFARAVVEYDVLPSGVAFAVGLVLIPLELLLALAHLTGWMIVLAVPVGCFTLVAFTIAVSVNLASGRSLPCYCFGTESSDFLSPKSLVRLLFIISGELAISFGPGFWRLPASRPVTIPSLNDGVILLSLATSLSLTSIWVLQIGELLCLLPKRLTSKSERIWGLCAPSGV